MKNRFLIATSLVFVSLGYGHGIYDSKVHTSSSKTTRIHSHTSESLESSDSVDSKASSGTLYGNDSELDQNGSWSQSRTRYRKHVNRKAAPQRLAAASGISEKSKEETKFSLIANMGVETNLHRSDLPTHEAGIALEVIPGVSFGDFKASLYMPFEYSLSAEEEAAKGVKMGNSVATLGYKGIDLGDYVKFTPSVNGIIPTKVGAFEDESLITSFDPQMKFAVNTKNLGDAGWNLAYTLNLTRYFHQYTTKASNGAPNNAWRMRNRFDLGYTFFEKLGLSTRMDLTNLWNYQSVHRFNYRWSQSISFQFTDNVGADVSHALGGVLYNPDGSDSTFALFDPEASTISFSLSFSI